MSSSRVEKVTINEIATRVREGLKGRRWSEVAKALSVGQGTLSNFQKPEYLAAGNMKESTVRKMAKFFHAGFEAAWIEALCFPERAKLIAVGFPFCLWSAPLFEVAESQPIGCEFDSSAGEGEFFTAKELMDRVREGHFDAVLLASDVVPDSDPELRRVARVLHGGPGPAPLLYLPRRVAAANDPSPVNEHQFGVSRTELFEKDPTSETAEALAWRCLSADNDNLPAHIESRSRPIRPKLYYAPGTIASTLVEEILSRNPIIDNRGVVTGFERIKKGSNSQHAPNFEAVCAQIARQSQFREVIRADIRDSRPFMTVTWAPFSFWLDSSIRQLENEMGVEPGFVFHPRLSRLYPRLGLLPIEFDLFVRRDQFDEITTSRSWYGFWKALTRACGRLKSASAPERSDLVVRLSQVFQMTPSDVSQELDLLRFDLMIPGNLMDWRTK